MLLTHQLDTFRHWFYDTSHHIETRHTVSAANLDVIAGDKSASNGYMATDPHTLRFLFDHMVPWETETTFIDLGSGKGAVMLAAARYQFRKIIGVEFAQKLAETATRNVRNYRGRLQCRNLEVICAAAGDFRFPSGPLMIYYFNSFGDRIMRKVVANLAAAVREESREIRIVCHSWHHREMFATLNAVRIQSLPWFKVYRISE